MFNSTVSMRELELETVQLLPRRETLCVMRLHAAHGGGYGCGDNYGCGSNYGDSYGYGCGDSYSYGNDCGYYNYNYDYGCNL